MHLLERYSLACGINPQKLGKGSIFELYYNVPFKKYIIIHASSGMQAKNYDYYNEVLDFCHKSIIAAGYGIVQIGGKEDPAINNCLHLQGKTNIHQTAYIIKRASAIIGNDSFSTHMASSFGIPSVTLYSVISPNQAGPFWKNEKQRTIMAPLKPGEKPSYSSKEINKKVNKINPEDILQNLFEILPDLDKSLATFPKSIFIGSNYTGISLNLIPDGNFIVQNAKEECLNIRIDLIKKENLDNTNYRCMVSHLSTRKCSIVTDKPIDTLLLKQDALKQNTRGVIFKLTEKNYKNIKTNQDFIREIKALGIPISIGYDANTTQEDVSNEMKIDYMDEGFVAPIRKVTKIEKDLEKKLIEEFNDKKTKIRSRMIFYSKGKNFLSEQCLEEQVESKTLEFKPSMIKKTKNLIADLNYFYVYK